MESAPTDSYGAESVGVPASGVRTRAPLRGVWFVSGGMCKKAGDSHTDGQTRLRTGWWVDEHSIHHFTVLGRIFSFLGFLVLCLFTGGLQKTVSFLLPYQE